MSESYVRGLDVDKNTYLMLAQVPSFLFSLSLSPSDFVFPLIPSSPFFDSPLSLFDLVLSNCQTSHVSSRYTYVGEMVCDFYSGKSDCWGILKDYFAQKMDHSLLRKMKKEGRRKNDHCIKWYCIRLGFELRFEKKKPISSKKKIIEK